MKQKLWPMFPKSPVCSVCESEDAIVCVWGHWLCAQCSAEYYSDRSTSCDGVGIKNLPEEDWPEAFEHATAQWIEEKRSYRRVH